jgi:hypothetical protein
MSIHSVVATALAGFIVGLICMAAGASTGLTLVAGGLTGLLTSALMHK